MITLQAYLSIDRSCIDTPDWLGRTPLMRAARHGDAASVSILLLYGANVHAKDIVGDTVLDKASKGLNTSYLQVLLEAGAHPSVQNAWGEYPPMTHIRRGLGYDMFERILHVMLNYGFDINCRDYQGRTLVHYAVNHHHHGVIPIIQALGADLNILDETRSPPIEKAVSGNELDCLNTLSIQGAAFTWQNNDGGSDILGVAAIQGSAAAMEILAKVNRKLVHCSFSQLMCTFCDALDKSSCTEYRTSTEEEPAAFQFLLLRRGKNTDGDVNY
jgi:hypothetical protein